MSATAADAGADASKVAASRANTGASPGAATRGATSGTGGGIDEPERSANDAAEVRRGTIYGAVAYGLWGVFPLYFHLLAPSGAVEILAHRILWSLLFCAVLLAIRRDFGFIPGLLRDRRLLGKVAAAGVLVAVNWVIYVSAVLSNHVTEAALGYFLNPIVTVGLGVIVLHERLRVMQWVAVGVGLGGAAYLTVASGRPPWIALGLAFSFALYGLMKNRIGGSLDAVHGLAAETAVLAPVAVIMLVVLMVQHSTTFLVGAPAHPILLAVSGVVTALPLLLFAAAARRVPLVTIGLLQFLTPIMQLLCGVLLLGETMSTPRWIGFAVVWLALVLLAGDSVLAVRRARALRS